MKKERKGRKVFFFSGVFLRERQVSEKKKKKKGDRELETHRARDKFYLFVLLLRHSLSLSSSSFERGSGGAREWEHREG